VNLRASPHRKYLAALDPRLDRRLAVVLLGNCAELYPVSKEAVNSQYRNYYQALKTRLQAFSDVVYYEPLSERGIRELEKHLGQTIKPLYREYLRAFGLTQDIFETFRIDRETMLEVFDSIRDSRAGYLPLSVDLADAETLYLLNNRDQSDQPVPYTHLRAHET